MAIYDPSLFLTRNDKEVLQLLGELVLAQEGVTWKSNAPENHTVMSDGEAIKLLGLLQDFIETKRFKESAYFVENVFSRTADLKILREIYLKWRKAYGRSRAVATVQWEELLLRLGATGPFASGEPVWYRASAIEMPIPHFLRMESKLTRAADLSPYVSKLILEYVSSRVDAIEDVRSRRITLTPGTVRSLPESLISSIKSRLGYRDLAPIPTTKIAAVMTIVMDMSALYTTRDWSVTGFLSTIAGALPPAILD